MQKLALILIALATALPARADVKSQSPYDQSFIRVTATAPEMRRFELCTDSSGNNCRILGDREFSLREINALRDHFDAQTLGRATIDLVAAWGVAIITALKVGSSVKMDMTPAFLTAVASGVGAGVVTGTGALLLASPIKSFEKRLALRGSIVDGRDVRVESVSTQAKVLEEALDGAKDIKSHSGASAAAAH